MSNLDSAIQTLVSRLETVTARLESVERQLVSGAKAAPAAAVPAAASHGAASGEIAPFVAEYDNLVATHIDKYVELSAKIGADVKEQADLVKAAVTAQRGFLVVASQSKKPANASVVQKLIEPTSEILKKIVDIRDKNRTSKNFNHLSTLSEGIGALGWVVVSPTPGPFVDEARASSEFYSNRVLKDFKGKDQLHVDWVAAWNTFLKDLRAYIKNFHTTELTWNPAGGDASLASTAAPPAGPKAGGPPPPPAIPSAPLWTPPPAGAAPAAGGEEVSRGALFADLNKGADITSKLKKVTPEMKSKNRTDKASVVPAKEAKEPQTKAAAAPAGKAVRPPKIALEGNKWVVENHVNNKTIVIDQTEPKHTVYIFNCTGTVVQIKGKVNSIAVDACKKSGVVFENAISSCELVNCTSVEVQVSGAVPTVSIDKTSGVQLYLSKDSLHTEILTSKSSEMNVLIPGADANADLIEVPVPEQYKTFVRGNRLATEAVEHKG